MDTIMERGYKRGELFRSKRLLKGITRRVIANTLNCSIVLKKQLDSGKLEKETLKESIY